MYGRFFFPVFLVAYLNGLSLNIDPPFGTSTAMGVDAKAGRL